MRPLWLLQTISISETGLILFLNFGSKIEPDDRTARPDVLKHPCKEEEEEEERLSPDHLQSPQAQPDNF